MAPAAVRAVLAPLTVGQSFSPATIPVGATSTLTITLANSNAVALQGIAFIDNYPAQLVNAAVPNASIGVSGCSGTLTAASGGSVFSLAAGSIPAGVTCSYSVTVTSNSGGSYLDSTGIVSTPIGLNSPAQSRTLSVVTNAAPTVVSANAATFTIAQPGNFAVVATGAPAPTLSLSGSLPAGVAFNPSTGALSGVPAAGSAGSYPLTFTASNGVLPNATQNFTLNVVAAQLVFVAVAPCRVIDTRNAGGPIAAGGQRQFFYYSDASSWSWSAQGGSAGSATSVCPATTLNSAGGTLGTVPPAAAALTITVVNTTAAGNFVAWSGIGAAPNVSMLNWNSAGQVLANTTVIPAGGRGPGVQDFSLRYNGPGGAADVVIDVVGYYLDNAATGLQCVTQTAFGSGTHAAGTAFSLPAPACGAGYAAASVGCGKASGLPAGVYAQELAPSAARCTWFNGSAGAVAGSNYRSETVCCRVPGG